MIIVDPIIKLFESIGASGIAEALANLTVWSVLLRIVLAFIMAGIIGIERAARKHAAGLRTYILVCLGAVIIMLTDQFLRVAWGTGDGSRLSAAVITGVGFLGAGTILFTSRGQIKGLTTAAGLWAVACLGLCLGCGFYTASLITFVIIVLVLLFLSKFEKSYTDKRGCFEIHIEFDTRANLKEFVKYVRNQNIEIASVEHNPAYSQSGLSVYTLVLVMKKQGKKYPSHSEFVKRVSELPYVEFVEEI